MKTTAKWVAGALTIAGVIFALSPGPAHLLENLYGWGIREQFVFLTGVSAMSLMVLSMIISLRIPWLNHQMQSLDKAYIVHKWTGISTTLLLVFHWLGEKAPEWLVELGILTNPGNLNDGSGFSDLEIGLFKSGVALAEWTFYVVIILVIIALFKKIPYTVFRKTHRIFPIVFLFAAYHGATAQLKERWLTTPGGYLLLLLSGIGILAAFLSLFQRTYLSRKIKTVISTVYIHPDGILDIQLETRHKPFFHQAGQYAFLSFEHDKEPHPFTIVSSGDNPHVLRFIIKPLGDFTAGLSCHLTAGQMVEIEGPYGEFFTSIVQSDSSTKRQIWIAGGIGITPFISRLEYLANREGTWQPIDFWYSSRDDKDSYFHDFLKHLCLKSGVNFYPLNSSKKEYLTADMLHEAVGSFYDVSIWFCGPPAFARCLLTGLSTYNFDKRFFHYDNFSMR